MVITRMHDICEGISKAHQVTATLKYAKGYPATVNTPEQTEKLRQAAIKVVSITFHRPANLFRQAKVTLCFPRCLWEEKILRFIF
jgi:metal-dependent amidase/aminoacylase/carboxypeptidase family protein